MKRASSDVAFSPSVKEVQTERDSREVYRRVEQAGGFETEVDERLRGFLAGADSAYLASASADGQPYVQHRGGPKGFIRVLDEHTLGFVDFVGNRQYVTTGNLRDNERICLLVMDYARRRRVKIWGTARVVPATDALMAQLGVGSYRAHPEQLVLITVGAWDVNCPQHIPQKVDAADVAQTVGELRARIAELEAENRALKAERS
jgi:uncharacterized protein